jgi:hypothetical protein
MKKSAMCLCPGGALFLIAAVVAQATEVSRDEYAEAVEPICRVNTEANERILKGVRKEVQKGKLNPAAAALSKASRALDRTLTRLQAVPRPQEDKERLRDWFGYIRDEVKLFGSAAAYLRAGDKIDAQRMVIELTTTANRANVEVLPFEFHYCLLEPARIT